jgi:aldehyde dehydrogenase (NAD+)
MMIEHRQLYIDGQWVSPSTDDTLEVRSPSTEELIGRVPSVSPLDIDRAVSAARAAFDTGAWPTLAPSERAEYLRAVRKGLLARADEIAAVIAAEAGLPVKLWARVEMGLPFIDYFVDLAERYEFEQLRTGPSSDVLVRREPVGVVAAILPFNAPLNIALMKIAPALLAGCTVVFKPDPNTPLHSFILAEIFHEAGLPPGVINFVPAEREASEALVTHDGVDHVSFTGSSATGRIVGGICGSQLKRCTLELGGKSAAVVLDDADLSTVIPALAALGFMNNGEACVAQSRVLAPRRLYPEIVDGLAAAASALSTGDPLDPNTDIGPLITAAQRQRVEGFVARGVEAGAKVAAGGRRPDGLERGWYFEPTILSDVDNGMEVAQEEIFGPVVSVIAYENEAEAVALANGTAYGLSGTVWTSDYDWGQRIATQVRTGNFGINTFGMDPCAPFGGWKQSGLGYELGREGLEEFLAPKSVHVPADWKSKRHADRG